MIEANKDNFDEEVLRADKPVVVDFWGPNCQPCLKLMPEIQQLAGICQDKIKFVKVNAAENRRLCINLRVIGLPSFLVFKNGREVARISGQDLTIQDIKNMIAGNTQ